MSYALTSKSQVTLPKNMRLHLGVRPGDAVDFEPLPDGRVAIAPAQQQPAKLKAANPFRKFIGIELWDRHWAKWVVISRNGRAVLLDPALEC